MKAAFITTIIFLLALLMWLTFWTPFAHAEPPLLLNPPMDRHHGMGGNHPPPGAHDPYYGIKNKLDQSCCNGEDCKRVMNEEDFYFKAKGGYVLRETNEFIPEEKVAPSPDANYHLCRWSADLKEREKMGKRVPIQCLMIPPGGV